MNKDKIMIAIFTILYVLFSLALAILSAFVTLWLLITLWPAIAITATALVIYYLWKHGV